MSDKHVTVDLVDIPFPLSESTQKIMWLRVPREGLSDVDAVRLQEMIWSLVVDKASTGRETGTEA